MVSEMNVLRNRRADHPALERAMFHSRATWSDDEIREHMLAVELANIFEWAYLARRDGILDRDVWESWAETWRSVILASPPMQKRFTKTVWTFGRASNVFPGIDEFINDRGHLPDPFRPVATSGWKQRWEQLFGDEPR